MLLSRRDAKSVRDAPSEPVCDCGVGPGYRIGDSLRLGNGRDEKRDSVGFL